MLGFNTGELMKLTIKAYGTLAAAETGTGSSGKSPSETTDSLFVAFYNPETVTTTLGVTYDTVTALGDTNIYGSFKNYNPSTYSFELMFDGTGASLPKGVSLAEVTKTTYVADQIRKLKTVCYFYVGDSHRPNYLSLFWGKTYAENCVLTGMTITYTLFHRDGNPLRAKIKCDFKEAASDDHRKAAQNNQSPDVTHVRIVKQGDSLPLLCKAIYGDDRLYPQVARFNNLRNYRDLVPGQKLYFPPLLSAKA